MTWKYSLLGYQSSNPAGHYTHQHRLNIQQLYALPKYSMVHSASWEANLFAASQVIPQFLRNPMFHYLTNMRPQTVSILGQPNTAHTPTFHLLEVRPNIIHQFLPKPPQWSPFCFTQQDPINTPFLIHTRHMSSPSICCVHTVFISFVFISDYTVICATYRINWLVFITAIKVYSAR